MRNATKAGMTIAVIATILLAFYAYGLLVAQKRVTVTVTLKAIGVGIYWDESCTSNVTHINWGLVEPNSTTKQLVFIRSEGNSDANLALATENWDPPEATTYITLDWNYTGAMLVPNQVIPVNFVLTITNITGIESFSFVIIVIATG